VPPVEDRWSVGVACLLAFIAVGALLGGRRTTEGKPTNDPESKHAADLRATTLVC